MDDKEVFKLCVVCGDIAIARNFGAQTCKSCKPFFRRNAIKNKVLKCKNGGNCEINVITRKKCRKCRLDKCYAVGMRKELILNDVEKHFRRSLVEENRKRKQKCEEFQNSLNETEITFNYENSVSINSFKSLELLENNEVFEPNLIQIDSDSSNCTEIQFSDQSHDSIDYQFEEMEEFLNITEIFENTSDSQNSNQDIVPYSVTITRPLDNNHNNFTELEEYKLTELIQVFKPVVDSWNKNCILFDVKDVSEMVKTGNYFYEREINNFIKAINKFRIFEDICENDRIALVKYSCIDILSLRAIQCFDLNKDSWVVSYGDDHALRFSLDLFKELKRDIYIIYRHNLIDIITECDSDTVILDLLTAIALFNPNRPNLINRAVVSEQQHIYLYLLQRYLTFKYRTKPELEFKSTKLLNILINAHVLGQLEKKYFVGDYQEQYGPLVKEVFDLCK